MDGAAATEWTPTGSITATAPGKLNLYLAVGDRRDDGYHEVTTVFHAVSLVDEVTVADADVLSLEVTGPGAESVATGEQNLAWQAAELLAEHVRRAPDVAITVDKAIPVAGGMAGGGADAAAVLVAMNVLWDLAVPLRDLHALATRLGSDVPFALHGGTALGTGRGEKLATVLNRDSFDWVLAIADEGLPTRDVLAELDRLRDAGEAPGSLGAPEAVLAGLASGDPHRLAPLLGNELQAAALSLNPELRNTLDVGVGAGALAAMVAGSGSTCAFLCESRQSADGIAKELAESRVCRAARVVDGPVSGACVVPAPVAGV